MTSPTSDDSIEVSLRAESSPGVSSPLASALLRPSAHAAGLLTLPKPLQGTLPSGLEVTVTCERIPDGQFHLGIDEDGRLHSMGKFAGPLALRLFPAGHSSYVVNIERPGKRHGG